MKTWKKITIGEKPESEIGFSHILENLSDKDKKKLQELSEKMNLDENAEKKTVKRKTRKKIKEEV